MQTVAESVHSKPKAQASMPFRLSAAIRTGGGNRIPRRAEGMASRVFGIVGLPRLCKSVVDLQAGRQGANGCDCRRAGRKNRTRKMGSE
jgi:hypothetical protein